VPRKALTDRFLSSLKVKERSVFFDEKVRGLALRATPAGSRSWWFVYRVNGQPSQWVRLGEYDATGLAEARKLALSHRHDVDVERRDPAEEKRRKRAAAEVVPERAFTFSDLCDLYAKVAPGKKKTWREDIGKIKKHLRPAWGDRALRSITRAQVHELLDGLVAGGMTIGVNRIQALVSRLFTVAMDRSLIDAHPAVRMEKRFSEKPGTRALTDAELKALWIALDAYPGRAADALRLRLLLGQRGEEIAGMRWSEVDLEASVWQLPGERTKNGRPHAVPLPPTAHAILTRIQTEVSTGGKLPDRVFGAFTVRSDDHRRLGEIHAGAYAWKDLRRTVATRLAGLGFDETVIGRTLNHARATITAKHYNVHGYLDEKRRALEAWDRALQEIVTGAKRSRKVVTFQKSRRG